MNELTSKNASRTGFRGFIVSTVKIAIAITLSILILGGIGTCIGISYYRIQQNKQKSYAIPKAWEVETIETFEDTKFHLKTKWEDGYLYYQFEILGFPTLIKKHFDDGNTSSCAIIIKFYDLAGFSLYDNEITLNQFTRRVNGEDKSLGLVSNSKFYMSLDDYKRISSWTITWRL